MKPYFLILLCWFALLGCQEPASEAPHEPADQGEDASDVLETSDAPEDLSVAPDLPQEEPDAGVDRPPEVPLPLLTGDKLCFLRAGEDARVALRLAFVEVNLDLRLNGERHPLTGATLHLRRVGSTDDIAYQLGGRETLTLPAGTYEVEFRGILCPGTSPDSAPCGAVRLHENLALGQGDTLPIHVRSQWLTGSLLVNGEAPGSTPHYSPHGGHAATQLLEVSTNPTLDEYGLPFLFEASWLSSYVYDFPSIFIEEDGSFGIQVVGDEHHVAWVEGTLDFDLLSVSKVTLPHQAQPGEPLVLDKSLSLMPLTLTLPDEYREHYDAFSVALSDARFGEQEAAPEPSPVAFRRAWGVGFPDTGGWTFEAMLPPGSYHVLLRGEGACQEAPFVCNRFLSLGVIEHAQAQQVALTFPEAAPFPYAVTIDGVPFLDEGTYRDASRMIFVAESGEQTLLYRNQTLQALSPGVYDVFYEFAYRDPVASSGSLQVASGLRVDADSPPLEVTITTQRLQATISYAGQRLTRANLKLQPLDCEGCSALDAELSREGVLDLRLPKGRYLLGYRWAPVLQTPSDHGALGPVLDLNEDQNLDIHIPQVTLRATLEVTGQDLSFLGAQFYLWGEDDGEEEAFAWPGEEVSASVPQDTLIAPGLLVPEFFRGQRRNQRYQLSCE